MATKDNITYPFRKAAWKTARFFENPDEKKDTRNFWISAVMAGVLSGGGVIIATDETPDDTVIDGQEQRISSYKEQISFLKEKQKENLDGLREEWRFANPDKKTTIMTEINTAQQDFSKQAFSVLAGLHTENKVSEKEIGKLLELFESQIGEIESISFNGNTFSNIGDATHLHEAQAEYNYKGSGINRALDISKAAENQEFKDVATSPIVGLMVFGLYLLMSGMIQFPKLREYAHGPAPKKAPTRSNH